MRCVSTGIAIVVVLMGFGGADKLITSICMSVYFLSTSQHT